MLVLGITGGYHEYKGVRYPLGLHDGAACLVRDGHLIAAVEEERLNRVKYGWSYPTHAVRACLEEENVSLDDVDAVGFYFSEEWLDANINQPHKAAGWVFPRQGDILSARKITMQWFEEEFGWKIPDDRLIYVPHHLCHAIGTFTRSGMDEALIVVMDGRGEEHSGTIYRGTLDGLEELYSYSIHNSLGNFYLASTVFLGYGFGDQYKVMGLAPHGDPAVYEDIFDSLYELKDGGEYELFHRTPNQAFDPRDLAANHVARTCIAHGLIPRKKGEPFTQQHMDLAAGMQRTIERIVLHVVSHWARETGLSKLSFSGGVAHNSTLNGVLLRSGLFDEVFIHPASHDGGAAEGAALGVAHQQGDKVLSQPRLITASLGPSLGREDDVITKLEEWSAVVDYTRPDDVVATTAGLLADGAVVGWATGRSEFGPRALGNRSILADPRPKENQTRINAMVKKRESFRPFAPVVTPEAAALYFDLPDTRANYDFMSYVVPVCEDRRDELGAVTHVDGTARIQVIDPAANDTFYRLVRTFGELTGTPVLLNTSFNNNAEPIVQTVEDCLRCFLTTELDVLVIEGFVVRRRSSDPQLEELVPRLMPAVKLTKSTRMLRSGGRAVTYEIVLDHSPAVRRANVSAAVFSLLERVDGSSTVRELAETVVGLTDQGKRELYELWQERFVAFTPE
ncbi:carbamoyltransferase family protein [Phytoactinopolyspora mesophila]|uniref:Carbamoyltransferase n=1 Tax=Phytoactinopolyspora mesophila TaxID=2650750 RepID=A0A7K3M057_9ACTN|nr:carbamoyltransferase C-terminal domain-containing protein [Phytoactinopolyspora mesophila]NDL56654.1 carbamoyltransferase [Phytoactinopolyspora mesophila]